MLVALATLALLAPARSPPINCEIAMKTWCIVQLPATIEMVDKGSTREWKIATTQDVARAHISIIEDKFCDGRLTARSNRDLDRDAFVISSPSNCGLRIIVSDHDPGVRSATLVNQIIMLKDRTNWSPVQF
jgi:hypothetical protein